MFAHFLVIYEKFYNRNERAIQNGVLAQCDDAHFNTESWMEELAPYIKDELITKISMPGSHDSGTSMILYDSYIAHGEALPDKA